MPKAPKKTADRLRKQRFSPDELQALVDTLEEHDDIVFIRNVRREPVLQKKNIWALVAQRVSAVGTTPRIPKDCHKQWDGLQLRVRSILSAKCSQALQTGGGPSSPMKLMACEETCAALIGTESIEGVGEMECGASSSADGGSDNESGEPETSHASTSRGLGRVRHIPAWKDIPNPAPQRPMAGGPPPSLCASAQGTLTTPRLEESSIAGEVAAMAPLETVDSPLSICRASEEESYLTVHTPEPSNYPQVSCSDSGEPDTPGRCARGGAQEDANPVPSPPVEALSGHVNPIPCRDDTPSNDARRAAQLTALITELMEHNRQSRVEWIDELRAMRQVVTDSTNRLCEVLGRIADALEAARPTQPAQQEDTSSSSRSTPASPLRRSVHSQRRRDMPPPGPGSME
ncbi:myb-related transcription factor, partner of profilin-like [Ambystoma mexicanum]|uniref:myb-related transcription factor, partner of profilin-like n=1 Tax=Ambystoma mexicanum TaxID=8296 RepID=UPI0037E83929